MYTQCPHCQTLFRISAEQLEAAAGKAHCCRCDRVFSALANLREPQTDEEWPDSQLIDETLAERNLELPFDAPPADEQQLEMESGLTELMQALQIVPPEASPDADQPAADEQLATDDDRDPFEPPYVVEDPELDSVQIGLDSRLHDTVRASADTLDASTETRDGHAESSPMPFAIPDNLPEIPPTESPPLTLEESLANSSRSGWATFGWSLAVLLLLLAAVGQLAWFGRDHLLRYPAGRALLERACDLLPCQLPPRHEPEKLQVIARAITSHPEKTNALLVTLTLRNDGDFAQTWPQLELSLLDREGGLVARRNFGPEAYRHPNGALLQPGIPQTLRLELADPGDQVVGFQFEFR